MASTILRASEQQPTVVRGVHENWVSVESAILHGLRGRTAWDVGYFASSSPCPATAAHNNTQPLLSCAQSVRAAMKLTGSFLLALGVTPFAQLAHAQAMGGDGLPSASRGALTLTRFADDDVTDVGVGEVHPIGADEKEIEQDLVDLLEAGGQTTGEDR